MRPERADYKGERPVGAAVRDVMTTSVITLRKDADYKEIVSTLRRYRVSACPVIDATDRLIGVVQTCSTRRPPRTIRQA
jgi:CBS domain-containing protein